MSQPFDPYRSNQSGWQPPPNPGGYPPANQGGRPPVNPQGGRPPQGYPQQSPPQQSPQGQQYPIQGYPGQNLPRQGYTQQQQQFPPQQPQPSGRDPLGAKAPEHISIDQFQEPKSKSGLIIAIVVAAVIAGLAFAGWQVSKTPLGTDNTPTPTAPASPSKTLPSVDPSVNGVPFHSSRDDADGFWKLDKVEWVDGELVVTMTIEVTKGTLRYTLFALDNTTAQDYDPTVDDPDGMNSGTISEGESKSGVVKFRKNKNDTTVILANSTGRQITALVAKG